MVGKFSSNLMFTILAVLGAPRIILIILFCTICKLFIFDSSHCNKCSVW